MDFDFDGTVEDTVAAADGELLDVDVQLVGYDFGHVGQESLAVNALDFDGGIEEQLLVHVPFGVEDAVAEARLQPAGNGTDALVDFDAVLVVDISQDVVARNGVAAAAEDERVDVVFGDDDGLLLVEILVDDVVFRFHRFVVALFLLVFAKERNVLAPAHRRL